MRRPSRGIKVNRLFLGLGANLSGLWGQPADALDHARQELVSAQLRLVASSSIYATVPVGPGRQAPYLNAVLLMESPLAPAALLRLIKRIERQAGRRLGARWGPRSLDIDILDFGGRAFGWPPVSRPRGRLILPHPELHRRAFVLVPLLEVEPHWRHVVLAASGRTLLVRIPTSARRGVRRLLDFPRGTCDKSRQPS